MTLSELRKELKAIGFKVKLTSMSWGRAATFTDISGNPLPSVFGTVEALQPWRPLTHYRVVNYERLRELANNEIITGLTI